MIIGSKIFTFDSCNNSTIIYYYIKVYNSCLTTIDAHYEFKRSITNSVRIFAVTKLKNYFFEIVGEMIQQF